MGTPVRRVPVCLVPGGVPYRFAPSFSPDGRSLAFVGVTAGLNQVYAVNLDGGGETQLTSQSSNGLPSWGIKAP